MWRTCLTGRKWPSSSKRLLPPHTSTRSQTGLYVASKMYVPRVTRAVRRKGVRPRKSTDPNGSLPQRRIIVSQHVKNVVLVHGAFADGSGWKRVADILKIDGYKVSVAQPP